MQGKTKGTSRTHRHDPRTRGISILVRRKTEKSAVNPIAEEQWRNMARSLHWDGSPQALEHGLKELKDACKNYFQR